MILLLLSNTAKTVRDWLHDGLVGAAALSDPVSSDTVQTSTLWYHSPLLGAAAEALPLSDFGRQVSSFWTHSPLLTAAANSSPGFRFRNQGLPRYLDTLDEDEEEAIFLMIASEVFGA